MRYAYGITGALLLGGATLSLATGFPAGAQVAQNDDATMNRVVPRAGAPSSFADLTEQLQPAVVNISTRQRVEVQSNNPFEGTPFADLFNRRNGRQNNGAPATREAQSLGSGFIISADGFVVTNNHVVSAGPRGTLEEVVVTMPDGTEYEAELVGADPSSDLAVLKIDRREPFPFVEFGDSSQARVGDWVVAIGNPFGLGGTVTSGIVSSVLRSTGGGAYDRYIQTDASINRGNSGGPLFDMQGNVIGINNAIISPTGGSVGIGFAIPAETARPIVAQLMRGEEIERGYLGVRIQPVVGDLADSLGLPQNRGEFVQAVEPDGPAERAGIRAGDVVTRVNGREVTNEQTLSFLIANVAPGQTVPVDLLREGERRRVNVRVDRRPSEQQLAQSQMFNMDDEDAMASGPVLDGNETIAEKLGLQVVPLNSQIRSQLRLGNDTEGLAIVQVDPNADAARKGLNRGDVVLSVNYRPVTTIEEMVTAIERAEQDGREAVLLRVQGRNGPPVSQAVRLR